MLNVNITVNPGGGYNILVNVTKCTLMHSVNNRKLN